MQANDLFLEYQERWDAGTLNPERRAECEDDPLLFCRTYLPHHFDVPFSEFADDQRSAAAVTLNVLPVVWNIAGHLERRKVMNEHAADPKRPVEQSASQDAA